MWVRVGSFEGRIKDGDIARFRSAIEQVFIDGMAQCSGVQGARAFWPHDFDDDSASKIVCQVMVEYADRDGMIAVQQSDERNAVIERLAREVLPMFDGKIVHVNYECDVRQPS